MSKFNPNPVPDSDVIRIFYSFISFWHILWYHHLTTQKEILVSLLLLLLLLLFLFRSGINSLKHLVP